MVKVYFITYSLGYNNFWLLFSFKHMPTEKAQFKLKSCTDTQKSYLWKPKIVFKYLGQVL